MRPAKMPRQPQSEGGQGSHWARRRTQRQYRRIAHIKNLGGRQAKFRAAGWGKSLSVAETVISQSSPEIDAHLRIREIELDANPIKRLLGRGIAGHEERELLMPVASCENFLFE
jgi:hypothetical protein